MTPSPLINSNSVSVLLQDGKAEAFTVRELTIRELHTFCQSEGNSAALIALCIDRSIDSLDELTVESFTALLKSARELNFPPAPTQKKSGKKPAKAAKPGQSLVASIARACALGIEGGSWERILDLTPSRLEAILSAYEVIRAENTLSGLQATYNGAAPLVSEKGTSAYNRTSASLIKIIDEFGA